MHFMRLAILILGLLLGATPVLAETRLALVIGNAGYAPAVGPLVNPVNDAHLIAKALRDRGFVVTERDNATRLEMQAALRAYARQLANAGPGAIGFMYYSGHGVANPEDGRNYLIPVDATTAADASLWDQSVQLQQDIIDRVAQGAPQAVNVIVLDACRNELRLPANGKGVGDGEKGLKRIIEQPSLMIAFSTAPGAKAADRDETNATGPYATELARQLALPGQDLVNMFENVKSGVLSRTGRQQVPYYENGLLDRVVLYPGAAGATPPQLVQPAPAPAQPSAQAQSVQPALIHPQPAGLAMPDPNARKQLMDMGIAWTEDNFWSALREKDDPAVRLFAESGKKIHCASKNEGRCTDLVKDNLEMFLISNWITEQNYEVLIKYHAIESDECNYAQEHSSARAFYESANFYYKYLSKKNFQSNIVKAICSDESSKKRIIKEIEDAMAFFQKYTADPDKDKLLIEGRKDLDYIKANL